MDIASQAMHRWTASWIRARAWPRHTTDIRVAQSTLIFLAGIL